MPDHVGTIMLLLLFATPILFGGTMVVSGFLTPGGAADFGWFAYPPLSDAIHSPGVGADLWIMAWSSPDWAPSSAPST